MGYAVSSQQFTIAGGATIGITATSTNGSFPGAAFVYGSPVPQKANVSEQVCRISWGNNTLTYHSGITNLNAASTTFFAWLAWIE